MKAIKNMTYQQCSCTGKKKTHRYPMLFKTRKLFQVRATQNMRIDRSIMIWIEKYAPEDEFRLS